VKENEIGRPRYRELRDAGKKHPIEEIGKKLREMMPFVSAGKQKVSDISGGDTD
jgi:ketol-acid reductoisomerase